MCGGWFVILLKGWVRFLSKEMRVLRMILMDVMLSWIRVVCVVWRILFCVSVGLLVFVWCGSYNEVKVSIVNYRICVMWENWFEGKGFICVVSLLMRELIRLVFFVMVMVWIWVCRRRKWGEVCCVVLWDLVVVIFYFVGEVLCGM